MVKRYYEKQFVSSKTVKIFECPDCGFEFNAMHEVDEQVGGWECPLCEVDELRKALTKKVSQERSMWKMEITLNFTAEDIKRLIAENLEKQGFISTGKFNWVYDKDGDLLRIESTAINND